MLGTKSVMLHGVRVRADRPVIPEQAPLVVQSSFPEDRVASAVRAVIDALKDGFQKEDIIPLAISTIQITCVFVEVKDMTDDQKKVACLRVMNKVIDEEAQKRPSELTSEVVASIKSVSDAALDEAIKLAQATTCCKPINCCRSCVLL